MSRHLSSHFLADPHGYAQTNVICLAESASRPIDLRATHYDRAVPELQESLKYSTIHKDHRVAYGDMEVGQANAGYNGAHVVRIHTAWASGYFPMFWLPYKQNDTRKITLKDKRGPDAVSRDGDEPRVFFTSALNGCSVFIEGTLEHPTVTHANAGSFRVTQGAIDDNKTHDDRIGRTMEIERRLSLLPQPKNVTNLAKRGTQTVTQSAVLHGHNYLPNYFKTDAGKQNTVEAQYVQRAKTLCGLTAPGAVTGSTVDHTALVFGYKSPATSQWEFWVQQRARVRLDLAVGGSQFIYVGRKVKPFWPGNRYVHVRGNHPYNTVIVQNAHG